MEINKQAVKEKIKGILAKYDGMPVEAAYNHLYKDIEKQNKKVSHALECLHEQINGLFSFMNYKNEANKHYNADESRELLSVIREIENLKKLFDLFNYTLEVDNDYLKHIQCVKKFLEESGGSAIPEDFRKIKIKDVQPIFKLSRKIKPLRENANPTVDIQNIEKITSDFVKEQMVKCKDKIDSGDYSGAITNSRSLVEAVIKEIYQNITGENVKSKRGLTYDWKNLAKELNLHPKKDSSDALKQILQGLASIIHGLAEVRNKMSDAHGNANKPEKHHAILVVNAALTITDFLFDTYEYQLKTGKIKQEEKKS